MEDWRKRSSNNEIITSHKMVSWSGDGEYEVLEHNTDFLKIDFFSPETQLGSESLQIDIDKWNEYTKALESCVNDPERFIDSGGAGKVYTLNLELRTICVKIIERRGDNPAYNLGNNPRTEAHIQKELQDISVEGVISPEIVDLIEGPVYSLLVMEEIPGINLRRLLNGEYDKEEYLNKLNIEDFTDSLYAYLDQMHEKGYVHGDFYARNVMVDIGTLKPVVIDFGRSKSIKNMDKQEAYRLMENDYGLAESFLDELKVKIQNLNN